MFSQLKGAEVVKWNPLNRYFIKNVEIPPIFLREEMCKPQLKIKKFQGDTNEYLFKSFQHTHVNRTCHANLLIESQSKLLLQSL